MRLLTLNCHAWQEENQEEKIEILARTIVDNDYDVIALQEVSQKNASDARVDEHYGYVLLDKLKALGRAEDEMVWTFSHYSYDTQAEGLAILTRLPIVRTSEFFITASHDPAVWKTRSIVRATVLYGKQEIDLYSCHLGWWNDLEEPYKEQVDRLMEKVDSQRLSILLGDFNNDAGITGEGYTYLVEKGLFDTYTLAENKDSGVTISGKIAGWSENERQLRIDFIFANQPVRVAYSRVIFNGENQPVVSDHFGVEVELATE
ncbi:endonuclease/exonuclease/phosphatase family protein [Jeotgalibacillus campisalis]|uniref:Endonuclease n=1 Tax=Jeotgalibacillus campisalis TaxID=220754 RepID=A0A0C2V1Y8_9BACL|nr:endonuclease/exonuclease/phosphatase family protein [Jeotgalibacillus campisalis]KIL43057.1 endonuclease [Jeotgalibacillus campisalis]